MYKAVLGAIALILLSGPVQALEVDQMVASLKAGTQEMRERYQNGQINRVCWQLWSIREYEILEGIAQYREKRYELADQHIDNGAAIRELVVSKVKAGQCDRAYRAR